MGPTALRGIRATGDTLSMPSITDNDRLTVQADQGSDQCGHYRKSQSVQRLTTLRVRDASI